MYLNRDQITALYYYKYLMSLSILYNKDMLCIALTQFRT
jgi:hypothetical protein